MKFKDVLYTLRTNKGLSQAKLAQELKLSPGLIGMYENGSRKPSVEAQEAIADYFNVSLDYLMGRDSKSIYYLDPEAANIAQEVFENPDLRILFDAAQDSAPQDLKLAADMLKRMKGIDD